MSQRGFTLIELVVTLIIVGILAAVALPRFFNRTTFDTLGFYDQSRAAVRYAHKLAIAQRRSIFVAIASSQIQVCYGTVSCVAPVADPVKGGNLTIGAPAGVSLSPAVSFSFNGLGQPSTGVTVNVSGDTVRSFTVEAETGYVR